MLRLLTLMDDFIVAFGNISSVSSVTCDDVLGTMAIDGYMAIDSHNPIDIFSKGNFFYLFIYFLESYQSMIKYNNVIK